MLADIPGRTDLSTILRLARKRMAEGQYLEAEKALKSALAEYSLSPQVHRLLEEVYLALNRPEEAEGHRKIYEALR